jgi:Uncharacterized conserved protein
VVLGLVVHRTLWALAGLALVVFAWLLWLVPRQVRALGYAEAADDLLIRRGIMFKTMSIVPYGRMQFVDVHQGAPSTASSASRRCSSTPPPPPRTPSCPDCPPRSRHACGTA